MIIFLLYKILFYILYYLHKTRLKIQHQYNKNIKLKEWEIVGMFTVPITLDSRLQTSLFQIKIT